MMKLILNFFDTIEAKFNKSIQTIYNVSFIYKEKAKHLQILFFMKGIQI